MPSALTPSWIRAPPESLMPMTGTAVLQREVHHLHDLLAVYLTQGAAEDGEVLREDGHRAALDGAVAGDDAVAVGRFSPRPKLVERRGANSSSSAGDAPPDGAAGVPTAWCGSAELEPPGGTSSRQDRAVPPDGV
jgi:hypothetical protein